MANLSRAKGQRSGTRMLAVEARRAGRQSTWSSAWRSTACPSQR